MLNFFIGPVIFIFERMIFLKFDVWGSEVFPKLCFQKSCFILFKNPPQKFMKLNSWILKKDVKVVGKRLIFHFCGAWGISNLHLSFFWISMREIFVQKCAANPFCTGDLQYGMLLIEEVCCTSIALRALSLNFAQNTI